MSAENLERRILNRLTIKGYIHKEEIEHAGTSLEDLFNDWKMTTEEGIEMLFSFCPTSEEVKNILRTIFFWGISETDKTCCECGCDLEYNDSDWNDFGNPIAIYKCKNGSCSNKEEFKY